MEIKIIIDDVALKRLRRWILLGLVLLPLGLVAKSTVSYPIAFSPGTVISSADVNANFAEAYNRLDYILEGDTVKHGALLLADGNLGVQTSSASSSLEVRGNLSEPLLGTVAINKGSSTLYGTGTSFQTQLRTGDAIKVKDEVFRVSVISSQAALTLDSPHQAGCSSETAYTDQPLLKVSNGDGAEGLRLDKSGRLTLACTEGTKNARWSGNGHCYMYFSVAKDFLNARLDCESRNAYLVTPTSQAELDFLRTTLGLDGTNFWAGATDARQEGSWEWLTGEVSATANDTVWMGWAAGEPNNTEGVEDCLEYQVSSKAMNDRPCNFSTSYVCERNL